MKTNTLLIAASATFALASISNAAVDVTTVQTATVPTFSTTDLGQTAFLSSSGTSGFELGTEHAQLFNGLVGNEDNDTADSGEVSLVAGDTFTINFDVSVNTLGYDITGIDSIFGWNPGAGGRSNQGYSVTLGFVGGGSAILFDATHWEPNPATETYWTTVSFANEGGGALFSDTVDLDGGGATIGNSVTASGVQSITFGISESANAGSVAIAREFDIFGTATVPEPGTYALLAGLVGLASVMIRRRR